MNQLATRNFDPTRNFGSSRNFGQCSGRLSLGLAIMLASGSVFANLTPDVLHTFSLEQATGNDGELVGAKPHTPPVYNPVDGKLYGVTPSGGLMGAFSTQYRFTPGAENSDYESASNSLNVVGGFHTGLVVDDAGAVFGGANPLTLPFPLPIPTHDTGILFQWTDADGLTNAFPDENTDADYGDAFKPRGLLAVDETNNIYFGGGSGRIGLSLFRRTAAGALEQLVDFSREEYVQGAGSSAIYLKGQHPAAVVFSEQDQAVYGLSVQINSAGAGDPTEVPDGDEAAGTLFRVNAADFTADGSSPVEVLHTFARNAEGAVLAEVDTQHALIEAGDWLYGTSEKAVWRIKKGDPASFMLLHEFGSGDGVEADADGAEPYGPLVMAEDGNIYGTTRTGFANDGTARAGTIYRIVIGSQDDREDDAYQQQHQFNVEQGGAWPVGLVSGPSVDGIHTLFGATARGGSEGDAINPYDVDGLGAVYSVAVAIPGSLTLTSDQAQITLGETVTLTWQSQYLQTCNATGDWQDEKAVEGTETLTPEDAGQLTFTLNCQDVHGSDVTASVQLEVAEDQGNAAGDGGKKRSGGSSGGGSVSWWLLGILGLASAVARRRRASFEA